MFDIEIFHFQDWLFLLWKEGEDRYRIDLKLMQHNVQHWINPWCRCVWWLSRILIEILRWLGPGVDNYERVEETITEDTFDMVINEDDHMNDVYSTVEVQCSQNK